MTAHKIIALGIILSVLTAGCAGPAAKGLPPLEVVPSVNLARYMGTWYEIASFPHSFQKGCTATKATYTLRSDGTVGVINECRRGGLDGELTTAEGTAKVTDPATNARLKVTFFRPFYGAYWIIDLGKEYEYAVVGHPGREYLWILNRERTMDEALYGSILERLRAQHYDVTRLQKTVQPR